jgi:peptidoglycan/LPS O-acetylase OafA/YrhL
MESVTNKRFFALDAFRGIMACSVVLLHTTVNTPWLASSTVRNSHIAVDFFFILSGFVICMTYADKLDRVIDLKKFAIKRFLRLWPLHFVIMCLFLFLRIADFIAFRIGFGNDSITSSNLFSFVKQLAFLHVFVQGVPMDWNFPAWSISVEIVAYIVFALLVFSLKSRFIQGLLVVFTLSFLILMMASSYEFDAKALRAITGFCLGAIIADLFFRRRIYKYRLPAICEFLALMLLITVFGFYGKLGSIAYPVMLVSFSTVLTIFAFETGPISSTLQAWPFQRLGLYSYAIYMIHILVMEVIGKSVSLFEKFSGISMRVMSPYSDFRNGETLIDFGNAYLNFFMPLGILLLVIFTAWISYKMIESPWIKKAIMITSSMK